MLIRLYLPSCSSSYTYDSYQWMANFNICDYSFLVGIHYVQKSLTIGTAGTRRYVSVFVESWYIRSHFHVYPVCSQVTDPSDFKNFMGGILSSDGQEVYYLAIIDILTQYVFKKKGERFLKSLIHDAVRLLLMLSHHPRPHRCCGRIDNIHFHMNLQDQISAMPPKPYQLRFQKYVNNIIE